MTLVLDLLGEFALVDPAVMQASPFVRTLQPLIQGSASRWRWCSCSSSA